MNVITFLNEKGGVGKTTMASAVAAVMAARGKRVVLIDADPQGHATIMLGHDKSPGLYSLIVHQRSWSDTLFQTNPSVWGGNDTSGELLLLPGNIETMAIPIVCDPTLRLRERLTQLEKWADIIIIDTPPTPSALQTMIYLATSHLIYPSKCEHLSLDGLAESSSRLSNLNKTRQMFGINEVTLLGVLPTMVNKTEAHRYGKMLITRHFGEHNVLPSISQSTVWSDANFSNQLLPAYAPKHPAYDQLARLTDKIQELLGASHV
jgi:chromosome partitioning protein